MYVHVHDACVCVFVCIYVLSMCIVCMCECICVFIHCVLYMCTCAELLIRISKWLDISISVLEHNRALSGQ